MENEDYLQIAREDYEKHKARHIKEEVVDDEYEASVPSNDHNIPDDMGMSDENENYEAATKRSKTIYESPVGLQPNTNLFQQGSHNSSGNRNAKDQPSAHLIPNRVNRDPRLKKQDNVGNESVMMNDPSSLLGKARRQAFLDGTPSTEFINMMPTIRSDLMPVPMKEIKMQCTDAHRLIQTKTTNGMYANIPSHPLAAGGTESQRSPLVANNHNSIFVSQATVDNVGQAMVGNRYRNIPLSSQNIGSLVGADLDAISRTMSRTMSCPVEESPSSQVLYEENKRSIHVQTDSSTNMVDVEMQTSENSCSFFCTIPDLSVLSSEQRRGLETFKRLMDWKVDSSTSAIAERLEHLQANKAHEEYKRSRDRNRNKDDEAGPSGESDCYRFSNPPPPSTPRASSSAPTKSKYANGNAMPM